MKFVNKNLFYYSDNIFNNIFTKNPFNSFFKYYFKKKLILSKNYLNGIRPGLTKNKKKNSIIRDENLSLIKQYINLNQKKGKKRTFFKNTNLTFENLLFCFNDYMQDFNNHQNYNNLVFLHNTNFAYFDINEIFDNYIKSLESIFEIKTIKNNKKLKPIKKYSHKIVYLPRKRRLKYVLKSLSLYKENFKKYDIWERVFWSFFLTLIYNEKSAIAKRKTYIYLKSIKFFKK